MKRYLRRLSGVLNPVPMSGCCTQVERGTSLVLGSAINYETDDVRAFVLSLRQHYAGPAAIVVSGDNTDLRTFLHSQRVEAVVAEDLSAGVEARVELVRYAHFLLYARQQKILPEQVLLTDTRDVLFQAPPFWPTNGCDIRYFTEADDRLLCRHPTGEWIASTFNPSIAGRLAERPCICCGTIYIAGHQLAPFLTLVLSLAAIPRFAQAQSFGIDQAVINYIGHFGLLRPAEISGNFGMVATLGLIDSNDMKIDAVGRILNPDGTCSPLVHQYDRHSHLWADVLKRYSLGSTARMREAEADKSFSMARRLSHYAWAIMRRIPELR
jgi:hypothetical protein